MAKLDLNELVEEAKRQGRTLLVVDLGEKPQLAIGLPKKDLPWAIGKGLSVAIRYLYSSNKGKYTKSQIVEAVVRDALDEMNKHIKDIPETVDEYDPDGAYGGVKFT